MTSSDSFLLNWLSSNKVVLESNLEIITIANLIKQKANEYYNKLVNKFFPKDT